MQARVEPFHPGLFSLRSVPLARPLRNPRSFTPEFQHIHQPCASLLHGTTIYKVSSAPDNGKPFRKDGTQSWRAFASEREHGSLAAEELLKK
jgi:hypothetical protein